ncbi:MAG TPA: DUF1850 domain-containing protein [Clostridia bacterium]|nr:DUF1850 domain-containing protein [Clostridia bacterium]
MIIVLAAAGSMPLFERFTITNEKSGSLVFQDRVEKYREFHTSFTHSVNRTPVNEYYRISEGKLVLQKATFYSYGAGMPEAGEYGSSKPSIINGMVQIDNINKVFPKFTIFAGINANHSLNTNDSEIFFSQFVKPQTPVTFEVKKVSLITLIRSYWSKK